jgi:hypothetical protein
MTFPNPVGPAYAPTQFLTPSGFIQTYSATVDPVATNDSSQGFGPGSEWLNIANGRLWTNAINTVGAAVWVFSGVATAIGGEPSGITTQFGSGTNYFPEEGNIYRETLSVAGARAPGGTGADYVVGTFNMSANSFDIPNRGLQLTNSGAFAANGNTKRIKIISGATSAIIGQAVVGGTVIADTLAVTTNGGGWQLSANVFKTGATGSNTQLAIHSQAQIGGAVAALLAPQSLTMAENAIINFCVTINNTTNATDATYNWFEINAMN